MARRDRRRSGHVSGGLGFHGHRDRHAHGRGQSRRARPLQLDLFRLSPDLHGRPADLWEPLRSLGPSEHVRGQRVDFHGWLGTLWIGPEHGVSDRRPCAPGHRGRGELRLSPGRLRGDLPPPRARTDAGVSRRRVGNLGSRGPLDRWRDRRSSRLALDILRQRSGGHRRQLHAARGAAGPGRGRHAPVDRLSGCGMPRGQRHGVDVESVGDRAEPWRGGARGGAGTHVRAHLDSALRGRGAPRGSAYRPAGPLRQPHLQHDERVPLPVRSGHVRCHFVHPAFCPGGPGRHSDPGRLRSHAHQPVLGGREYGGRSPHQSVWVPVRWP